MADRKTETELEEEILSLRQQINALYYEKYSIGMLRLKTISAIVFVVMFVLGFIGWVITGEIMPTSWVLVGGGVLYAVAYLVQTVMFFGENAIRHAEIAEKRAKLAVVEEEAKKNGPK